MSGQISYFVCETYHNSVIKYVSDLQFWPETKCIKIINSGVKNIRHWFHGGKLQRTHLHNAAFRVLPGWNLTGKRKLAEYDLVLNLILSYQSRKQNLLEQRSCTSAFSPFFPLSWRLGSNDLALKWEKRTFYIHSPFLSLV